jgi:hypothetical protein
MRIFILWSDSLECWLTGRNVFFCRVTSVSIQAFVEGLLRLANVLEATNGTLKNLYNICTLAINSTKCFVLFSGDLTGIRWRVLHMFTAFAAFVSTRVTLAYSCVRLWHLCPHQQVSQSVWLFEGNHGRLRKDFWQFEFFFDRCPMPTNGVEAVSQTGWYVTTHGVHLHFCFSLYGSKLLLEMLLVLLKLFLIILCL